MAETQAGNGQSGYRWVIVITAAAMLAIAMGLLVNGMSVFFLPVEQECGWSRGPIALINTSGLIGLALGGIVMGRIADRTNKRNICLFGSVVLGVCVLLASWARELWQFYVLFFVGGALGGGSLFAPLFALVGNWFRTGAGLAIGIASAGQAVGQGGVPFGTTFLIDALGWRGAIAALGVIIPATFIPLALLIREPPRGSVGATADDTGPAVPISTNAVMIWLSAAVIFCCTCMSVPLMHLVPLIQGNGLSAPEAGSVLFLLLVVAIAGRVAFGRLADIIGAIPAYMTASLWQTVLVFWFTQIHDLNNLYVFASIYGFGYAGVMTGLLTTIRALTPASRRAGSTGVIIAFAWLGHGIGGYQGGLFFDLTGTYNVSFANAALAGIINLLIVGALYLTIRHRVASSASAQHGPTRVIATQKSQV
jgi:MFS family permease